MTRYRPPMRFHGQRFLDFPCISRYHHYLAGVLKTPTLPASFKHFHILYRPFPPIPLLLAKNDCSDLQTFYLSSQGSPPLHHPWWHLPVFSSIRDNTLCSSTVSLQTSCFWLTGLVTPPTSCSRLRLLFMHNLKRPFFAQYDMPERYDLARKIFSALNIPTLS